jgi:hypothetical protein
MNCFSAGLKSSSPLLKQGAPTRFAVDDIGDLFSGSHADAEALIFFEPVVARLMSCPDTKQRAQWRDLQFRSLFLEMFFNRRTCFLKIAQHAISTHFQSSPTVDTGRLYPYEGSKQPEPLLWNLFQQTAIVFLPSPRY